MRLCGVLNVEESCIFIIIMDIIVRRAGIDIFVYTNVCVVVMCMNLGKDAGMIRRLH